VTFDEFQKLNTRRCREAFPGSYPWPIATWAWAVAGEAGELCNILKKVEHGDFTLEQVRKQVLDELADVVTYCDLAITRLNARTEDVIMHKFDEVSARVGWDG